MLRNGDLKVSQCPETGVQGSFPAKERGFRRVLVPDKGVQGGPGVQKWALKGVPVLKNRGSVDFDT